jgi:hypothetical protein
MRGRRWRRRRKGLIRLLVPLRFIDRFSAFSAFSALSAL